MKKVNIHKDGEQIGYYHLYPNWIKVFNMKGVKVFDENQNYFNSYIALTPERKEALENYTSNFIR